MSYLSHTYMSPMNDPWDKWLIRLPWMTPGRDLLYVSHEWPLEEITYTSSMNDPWKIYPDDRVSHVWKSSHHIIEYWFRLSDRSLILQATPSQMRLVRLQLFTWEVVGRKTQKNFELFAAILQVSRCQVCGWGPCVGVRRAMGSYRKWLYLWPKIVSEAIKNFLWGWGMPPDPPSCSVLMCALWTWPHQTRRLWPCIAWEEHAGEEPAGKNLHGYKTTSWYIRRWVYIPTSLIRHQHNKKCTSTKVMWKMLIVVSAHEITQPTDSIVAIRYY